MKKRGIEDADLLDTVIETQGLLQKTVIEHFGAGEIIPAYEIFDAVRNGTIDCGVSAPYYWISKHKAIPFFCTVPGGMTGIEKFSWINFGGGQELWDKLYEKVLKVKGGRNSYQYRTELNSVVDGKAAPVS